LEGESEGVFRSKVRVRRFVVSEFIETLTVHLSLMIKDGCSESLSKLYSKALCLTSSDIAD